MQHQDCYTQDTKNASERIFNLLFHIRKTRCIVRSMKSFCLKFTALALIGPALALTEQSVYGSELQRVDRYSLQTLSAGPAQIDLLSVVIDTQFPAYVETVGTALDYVLHRSGYRHIATQEILPTLDLPLPNAHRSIGPLDVRSAIRTIVGQPWHLYEDNKKRILWFQRAGIDANEVFQPPDANPESSGNMDPEITRPSPFAPTSMVWELYASRSLRENLEIWAQSVDWSLEWRSQHDYAIGHSAKFPGTFEEAVESVLTHYRNAPVPLTGSFYHGNSVLVIEAGFTRHKAIQ